AYAPQGVVLITGQVPEPSQTDGLVMVPALHDIARHVVSVAGMKQVALVPSQVPAHIPLPEHVPWPVLGLPDTNSHVPGVLPLQVSHVPLQAVLQQILSAQVVVMQSAPVEHACPCFPLQAPLVSQVPAHRPFGSSIPFAGAHV